MEKAPPQPVLSERSLSDLGKIHSHSNLFPTI